MNKTIKFLKEFQGVPNVPFATLPVKKYLEEKFKELGVNYEFDGVTYVVRIPPKDLRETSNASNAKTKLILMAHTDHPGFILKNKNEGKVFGTVGIKRLKQILKNQKIRLRVFDKNGIFLATCLLTEVIGNQNANIKVECDKEIPKNSIAQYDINYFTETEEKVKVYNADDGIGVALLLNLIANHKISNYFDIYVVFNLYEEVHQIGSYRFFRNNNLKITKKDLFINLECLKIDNVEVPQNKNTTLPKANYENGVVLQLSNTGCLFGYKSKKPNLSELIIKNICKKNSIKYQVGIIKDSCDSRCITEFNLTPNILTLTIPNRYKHNYGINGEIVPEEIYKRDIQDLELILYKLITTNEFDEKNFRSEQSLSYIIKQNDFVTDKNLMKNKKLLNDRLDSYYSRAIKNGYFYAETIQDKIAGVYSKLLLRYKYFFQKIQTIC